MRERWCGAERDGGGTASRAMSLPPIVPPPAAAPRSQPRKQQQQQQLQSPPAAAAPRKAAAAAGFAPAKPPRTGRGAPSDAHSGPFSSSWPSACLQKQLPRGRAAQGNGHLVASRAAPAAAPTSRLLHPSPARGGWAVAPPPGSGTRSCESLCADPGGRGEAALRFSLSLPPEAIRVLQRRSLEQERRSRTRTPRYASPDPATCSSGGGDWRALLKVSLLNERHRYDDVEYEEEEEEGDEAPGGLRAWQMDEGLVRKCTEWLRGVESAAARDQGSKLHTLPHLSTL